MNILISSLGTLGDVQPACILAKGYQVRGMQVSLLCTEDFYGLAQSYGIPVKSIPINFHAMAQKNAHLMGRPMQATVPLMRNLRTLMKAQREPMLEALKGSDALITMGIQLETASYGEFFGIPHTHLLHSPNWLDELGFSPPISSNTKTHHVDHHWQCFKTLLNLAFKRDINSFRKSLGLAPIKNVYDWARTCLKICYPQELSGINHPKVVHWYPPGEKNPLPDELETFLKAHPYPIYLGFGSMPGSTKKLAPLLQEICRQRGCGLILQGSGLNTFKSMKGVFVAPHLSHRSLFPRMSIIIHHGGAGTFHQACRSGTPQLVIPQLLDQFFWARRAWEMGIAPEETYFSKANRFNLSQWIERISQLNSYSKRACNLAKKLSFHTEVPQWSDILDPQRS